MKEEFSTVSARMTFEEKEALVKYCEKHDETISRVIRKLIKQFLESQRSQINED